MIIRVLDVVGVAHLGQLTALSPSQQRVIAILTAAGPSGLSADRFADELWPDDLPAGWLASVRMAISRMRRAVPPGSISTGNRRYALDVTTDEVDAWRLLDVNSLDLPAIAPETISLLLAGTPFRSMDPSPLLDASKEQIIAARIRLLDRLSNETTADAQLLESARSLSANEPFREDLLAAVARLHASAGWDTHASRLIDAGIARLEAELGLPASENLRQLARDLRGRATTSITSRSSISAPDVAHVTQRTIGNYRPPARSADLDRALLFGDAVSKLTTTGVVISGASGTGKTVLAQQVARDAYTRGNHIVWITARRNEAAAYGPLLAAMPMLRSDFAPLLADGGNAFERTRCWTAAIQTLRSALPEQPIVFVVDDAQWLDSHSQRFVEFLAGGQAANALHLVVVGRNDESTPTWPDFAVALDRSGLGTVILRDFDHSELVELIGTHHPQSTSRQRRDLARYLTTNKAALPVIAVEVIKVTDTVTLTSLPSSLLGDPTTGLTETVWVGAVSESTCRFAAAAALLGVTFRIGDVARLLDIELEEAAKAVDNLLDADVVSAEQRLDEFSFKHVLVQAAFETTLDRTRSRELHRGAAELADHDGDIHRRARHLYAAGITADNATVVKTLAASARDYQQRGLFREAIGTFSMLERAAATPLDCDVLLDFANALDRGGSDDFRIRQQAFDTASAAGEHDLTVVIALGGSTDTESANGDERRVDMLMAVATDRVTRPALRMRDIALVRELGLLGHHQEALNIAMGLGASANSPDEALAAWLAAWPSRAGRPPDDWDPLPPDTHLSYDPALRSHLLQVRCVQALTVGDHAEALTQLQQFSVDTGTQESALRSWYRLLLNALVAFLDGNWSQHDDLASQAFLHASQHGISQAFSTHAAQAFAEFWVQGSCGTLLPLLESAAPDVQNSLLAEAALATSLAATPSRHGDAVAAMTEVAKRITASESPFAPSAAALLASAVGDTTDGAITKSLREVLDPFLGLAVIVGGGVAHLGPASRALAFLSTERRDKIALLKQSVTESDAWNLRTWSVKCRLDLAIASGDCDLIAEAANLAEPSDLATRLSDHFADAAR